MWHYLNIIGDIQGGFSGTRTGTGRGSPALVSSRIGTSTAVHGIDVDTSGTFVGFHEFLGGHGGGVGLIFRDTVSFLLENNNEVMSFGYFY